MDDSRKEWLVLFITTLAGLACILQNHVGGWEFWVPWVLFAAGIVLWWIHFTERISPDTRIILYFVYAAFLLFYHGAHDTGLFDISVSALLFMVVFSLADHIYMLNLILLEYIAVMALQFWFLYNSGIEEPSSFMKMRIVYHVGTVLVMYFFSRISVKHRVSENERIERWQESARNNDSDMQDFLSNISHELRTPVNVINGMTMLLLRDGESEGVHSVQDAGIRLAHQIEDIQDYTEIRRNELVLEEDDYRVDSLINDVLQSYDAIYKRPKPELNIEVSPETPAALRGDIRKIRKIFRHLLDNAVKFTRRGGITVKVFTLTPEKGTNLVIEVTDTGIGMTRAEMARASRGLYQANKKRNRSTGGIGIGLAIVYGFVHKMGGFVMINSEKGSGTTVRVTIPARVTDPSPCQLIKQESGSNISVCSGQETGKLSFPGVRALIVDDEPMNLVVATGLLRERGMIPDTAGSGMEAIQMFETGDYDIIFMDHMMPEMDGVEAMRQIRRVAAVQEKNVVIVALTANVLSGAREMFQKEGFDGFIAKPIDMGELEHVMKHVLPDDLIVNLQNGLYQREGGTAADPAKGLEEKAGVSRGSEAAEASVGTESKKAVAILTGSMTDLPAHVREELQIGIIPSKIYTDKGTFYDNIDIDCEEVLRYMGDKLKPVSSDAPGVDEYISFFSAELKKAHHLIFITMTPSSSHEYGRATKAAESLDHVTVINSECVSSATGILAMIAAKLAKQDLPVEQIIAEVEAAKKYINCSFVIKTTDVMARRKRISPAMNNLLKTLWLRPMLQTKNDELKVGRMLLGNVKSCYEKYIRVALPKGRTPDTSFAFATYAGMDEEDLLWIEEELKKRGRFARVIFQKASAGITTNCGEGSFGILYLTKSDRDYQLGAFFDRPQDPGNDMEDALDQLETDQKEEPDFYAQIREAVLSPQNEEKWYEKLEGIDQNAALKNSGSEEAFRTVLKIFYDSIPKKSEEIDGYYTAGDWENYTIKVHALKSSAKLIGAMELADMAQSLENAGKAGDVTFIDINHKSFLNEYHKYSDRLSGYFEDTGEEKEKVSVDDDALQRMYEDVRKAAEEMDCDAVDEVVARLSEIAPPESERERIEAIIQSADSFDYDGIIRALQ